MVGRVAGGAVIFLTLVLSLSYAIYFSTGMPFRPDYSVFWTAARIARSDPSHLYDPVFVTHAQNWLVSSAKGLRPWAYPPSALLVFLPFSWMPFWISYFVWICVSATAFVFAASRFVSGRWLSLAVLSPPSVVAVVSGQSSPLVAAAMLWAVTLENSFAAGVVLGLAAAIKPQSLIAAPLMLNRKGMAGFVCGCAAAVTCSLIFGFGPWLRWVQALPEFSRIATALGLIPWTPSGLADLIGAPRLLFWPIGGALGVWLALSTRNGSPQMKLVGLIGGGLLITPYAMIYDTIGLMPVAALFVAKLGSKDWFRARVPISA
jgi:alpha-1,2-mannosyltransferase